MRPPTASQELVHAVRDLERTYQRSAWSTPLEIPRHRAALTRALAAGDQEYPARFEYRVPALEAYLADLDSIHDRARSIVGDNRLYMLVDRHLVDLRRSALAAVGGDALFTEVRVELDGLPDEQLTARALTILKQRTPRVGTVTATVEADIAADFFRHALRYFTLPEWTVQVSADMTGSMSVNGPLQRVRVRAGATFSRQQLSRLLAHEIGGHVLRWANSTAQEEALAQLPAGRTVPTEEGRAAWFEHQLGVSDSQVVRTYAARVLGVHLSQGAGILAVARALSEQVPPDAAIEIALRCKRGMRDPNNPGGPTKDWSYLGGMELIDRLARQDPEGLAALNVVKWSAEYVELAGALLQEGRLTPPRRKMSPEDFAELLSSLGRWGGIAPPSTSDSSPNRLIVGGHEAGDNQQTRDQDAGKGDGNFE